MKIRILSLLLLFALPSFATISVSGSLKYPGTGAVTSGTFVRFWMRGCGANQPIVSGTALLSPNGGPVWYQDFTPDSSTGAITGTLYSKSEVSCGGSTGVIYYGMQIFTNGGRGPEVMIDASQNINVNNPNFLSNAPVVAAPTGDSTYCRIDATNCTFTGAPAFTAGASLGTGTFSGNATLSGSINVKNVNNIPHCEQYGTAGVTPFQTLMASCVAALPSTGPGIVDATNITDATELTMTGNWTMNRSATTIRFGRYTVSMGTNSILVPAGTNNVAFLGATAFATDPSGDANGTQFTYTGSGTAISMGDTTGTSYGHLEEDLYVNLLNATGSAIGFSSTRIYGAELNRLRGACSVSANTATFIQINGTSTAPGGQSITIRNPVENNCQFGISAIGGTSPPLCNNTQYIGGQFSGNSAAGSIAIDIECGNDHELYGPYIASYDTGLKVAASSGHAVFGKIHIESCGTQGILMTAATANNHIWTDTGCATPVSDSGTQNTFEDLSYITGTNFIYGSLQTLGTTALNRFRASVNFLGNGGLPAATSGGSGGWLAGGFSSPSAVRIYCGDGTGFQCDFAKRTGSTDTVLAHITDAGVIQGAKLQAGATQQITVLATGTAASCTTSASIGATCVTTVSWGATLPDTTYRPVCTLNGQTNVPVIIATNSPSTTNISVTIYALTAAAASATINCVALE